MPNIASARKRVRRTKTERLRNIALRSRFRTAVKSVRKLVLAGDKDAATLALHEAQGAMDRVASKGAVHKNKARRGVSRLAAAVRSLA